MICSDSLSISLNISYELTIGQCIQLTRPFFSPSSSPPPPQLPSLDPLHLEELTSQPIIIRSFPTLSSCSSEDILCCRRETDENLIEIETKFTNKRYFIPLLLLRNSMKYNEENHQQASENRQKTEEDNQEITQAHVQEEGLLTQRSSNSPRQILTLIERSISLDTTSTYSLKSFIGKIVNHVPTPQPPPPHVTFQHSITDHSSHTVHTAHTTHTNHSTQTAQMVQISTYISSLTLVECSETSLIDYYLRSTFITEKKCWIYETQVRWNTNTRITSHSASSSRPSVSSPVKSSAPIFPMQWNDEITIPREKKTEILLIRIELFHAKVVVDDVLIGSCLCQYRPSENDEEITIVSMDLNNLQKTYVGRVSFQISTKISNSSDEILSEYHHNQHNLQKLGKKHEYQPENSHIVASAIQEENPVVAVVGTTAQLHNTHDLHQRIHHPFPSHTPPAHLSEDSWKQKARPRSAGVGPRQLDPLQNRTSQNARVARPKSGTRIVPTKRGKRIAPTINPKQTKSGQDVSQVFVQGSHFQSRSPSPPKERPVVIVEKPSWHQTIMTDQTPHSLSAIHESSDEKITIASTTLENNPPSQLESSLQLDTEFISPQNLALSPTMPSPFHHEQRNRNSPLYRKKGMFYFQFEMTDLVLGSDTFYRHVDRALEIAIWEECYCLDLTREEFMNLIEAEVLNNDEIVNFIKRKSFDESEFIELSLTDPCSFLSNLLSMSEELFDTIPIENVLNKSVRLLKYLIQQIIGPWKIIRQLLIKHSTLTNTPPRKWSNDVLQDLFQQLNIPLPSKENYTFCEFMNSESVVGKNLNDFLTKRWKIYRRVCIHLDNWWEKEIFPSELIVTEEIPIPRIPHSSVPVLTRVDEDFPPQLFQDKETVRIATTQKLFRYYLLFSRVYSWFASSESLLRLCDLISGGIGIITTHVPTSLTKRRLDYQTMSWISLQSPSKQSSRYIETILFTLQDIEPICGKYILIPSCCLKRIQQTPSTVRVRSLKDMPVGKITNGTPVRVVSLDILSRIYEKIPWWDRPSPIILQNIAGKFGHIISITDSNRVGVSLKCSNLSDNVEILPLDALLYEEKIDPPSDRSNNNQSPQENMIRTALSNARTERLLTPRDTDDLISENSTESSQITPEISQSPSEDSNTQQTISPLRVSVIDTQKSKYDLYLSTIETTSQGFFSFHSSSVALRNDFGGNFSSEMDSFGPSIPVIRPMYRPTTASDLTPSHCYHPQNIDLELSTYLGNEPNDFSLTVPTPALRPCNSPEKSFDLSHVRDSSPFLSPVGLEDIPIAAPSVLSVVQPQKSSEILLLDRKISQLHVQINRRKAQHLTQRYHRSSTLTALSSTDLPTSTGSVSRFEAKKTGIIQCNSSPLLGIHGSHCHILPNLSLEKQKEIHTRRPQSARISRSK